MRPSGAGSATRPAHDLAPAAAFPPPTAAEAAGDLALLAPRRRVASRPVRKVVVFGAGGPLAAATTEALAQSYQLRLTDVRPLAEIAAAGPQSPGAPLPQVLGPPHEAVVVDVTDPDQVRAPARGMDAIINCTVVRPHPVQAFRVNTPRRLQRHARRRGARHPARRPHRPAAGDAPTARRATGADFDVPDDAPARPGATLYMHTKFLGQEIVRVFAEQHDLEVPALLLLHLRRPGDAAHAGRAASSP